MARCAFYCRVSTDAQVEKYGLKAQEWGLKKRMQEKGYNLIDGGAFIDEGYSGGDLERPQLTRLRECCRRGGVDVVLIYDPDRLSRSLTDLLLLTDEFEREGIRLEFITQENDASPEGRMFFSMRGAVAEYERAKIRERTIRGRLQKARQGKVISGAAAPYGYRYDPITSTLVVEEEAARTVRLAYHLYTQERLSLVQLADRMNRLGLTLAAGGQRWHSSHVGRMLRNEAYAGTLWQNRWRSEWVNQQGRKSKQVARQVPKEEQIAVSVPSVVPRDIFDAAQRRLEENHRLSRRNAKREYLLSGLVRHACGSAMSGRFHNGKSYYVCLKSYKHKAPVNEKGEPQVCHSGWINGPAVESAVWDTVSDLIRHPVVLVAELEKLTEPGSATREVLEEFPKEERRLVEGYRKGFYADFMMREETERTRMERVAAETRHLELQRQLARLDKALGYRGKIEEMARRLSLGLDQMDFTQRREFLRLLVDEVIYEDGQLTIRTIIPVDGVGQLRPIALCLR